MNTKPKDAQKSEEDVKQELDSVTGQLDILQIGNKVQEQSNGDDDNDNAEDSVPIVIGTIPSVEEAHDDKTVSNDNAGTDDDNPALAQMKRDLLTNSFCAHDKERMADVMGMGSFLLSSGNPELFQQFKGILDIVEKHEHRIAELKQKLHAAKTKCAMLEEQERMAAQNMLDQFDQLR